MTLAAGTRLGPYEVTGAIGAGGMGEVYRARDAKLGREVAIKVLPAALAQDGERLARFEREARLLASLNHPNIAHVYGFESATLDDGSSAHFLAMELVEGEDLAERLKRGALPVDESLAIARQITEGLEEAHERGIIHRDLKPANVKVTPDGKVKVLDFGLAKALEGDPSSSGTGSEISHSPTLSRHMTEAGMIMGTAAYMSPEQARGKPVDKRADIWSFGVVLFEMLTGERLFRGETVSDVLAAVLTRDLDLKPLPSKTPDAVRRLLRRCLERDPKIRLRDIGEARVGLDSPTDANVSLAGPSWRERWAIPSMAVAVAALALSGWAWVNSGRKPADPAGPVVDAILDPGGAVQVLSQFGLALSPDGRRLAFVGRDDNAVTSLWLRDLAGGQAAPVKGTLRARFPFWSPDGQQLGFVADARIQTVDLVSGQAKALCPTNDSAPAGSWSSRGAIIFPHDGLIYRTDAGGSSCVPVTVREEGRADSEPVFFPDGERFTFRRRPSYTVRVGNLTDSSHQPWIEEASSAAVISSEWVLFARNPLSTVNQASPPLLAQRFDPDSLRLEGAPIALLPEIYTPNGKAAYAAGSNGLLVAVVENYAYSPLVWVDRSGGVLDTVASHATWTAGVSPDRRSVALGGFRFWVHSLERGVANAVDVSTERLAALYPSWSPDQRSMAFVAAFPQSPQLHVLDVAQGKNVSVFESDRQMVGTAWSSGDDAIVFWLYPGGDTPNSEVWEYSLKGKQARRLFEATPEQHDAWCSACLEISPDGRWLLYWIPVDGVADVYIRSYPEIGPPIKVSTQGGYFGVWSADSRTVYYVTSSGSVMAVDVGPDPSGNRLGTPRRVLPAGIGSGLYGVTKNGDRFLRRQGEIVSPPLRLITNWQKRASAAGL